MSPNSGQSAVSVPQRSHQAEKLKACDAALAMSKRYGDKSISLLVSLSRHGDPVVRKRAAECLMDVGGQRALLTILSLLEDPHPVVRCSAAGALGLMRDYHAITPLKKMLKHDRELKVNLAAARALGRLGDKSGMPLVVKLLNHKEQSNQRLAVLALADIVGHRFPANAEGIRAARRYIQTCGLELLGKIGR